MKQNSFMGTLPEGKLLLKLSLPAILAMMVNALYNLVDAMYIGRGVGPLGMAGLSISFPAQMLIMAFGMMIGTGAASIVSRALGARDYEKASYTTVNAFLWSLGTGLLVGCAGYFLLDSFLVLLGASDAIFPFAAEYLSVILFGSPFLIFAMCGNNLLRAEGMAKQAMVSMMLGALFNIVLDPLFIFTFKMGIRGAAIATVFSQFLSAAYVFSFYIRGKSSHHLALRHFGIKLSLWAEIGSLGVPAFIRQGGFSLVMMTANFQLARYGGDLYISSLGIINRLMMFLMMPMFGLAQGLQPSIGFNFGARLHARVKRLVTIGIVSLSLYSLLIFTVAMVFPVSLAFLFTSDAELQQTAARLIRIMNLFLPLVGFQVVVSTYFQSIGKAVPSLILNMSRQFFFLLPLLFTMPGLFGLKGILYSFPSSDFLGFLISVSWFLFELKHLKGKM